MAFTGKATYSSGSTLPATAEDVADLLGIISPYETPLLDVLGQPLREATSTYHEWIEDELLPNKDTIATNTWGDPMNDTSFKVTHPDRFRIGDQIQKDCTEELMLVTEISGDTLTVVRKYAGSYGCVLSDGDTLNILGNAALEGSERPTPRFSTRARKGNYTQIFTSSVEVSGSDLASSQLGLADEMDYQKQERLRELIRDLENTVLNGGASTTSPEGSSTNPRTLKGIMQSIETNLFFANDPGVPTGADLNEEKINFVLQNIWENSSGNVDLIVVNGAQKRKINAMLSTSRNYGPVDVSYRNMVNLYESDFGVCKVIMTRWMPNDAVLFLDSSRVNVLPLAGRNFHFKPLASRGDYESGELIGEYTLEFKNEAAHGLFRSLSTT